MKFKKILAASLAAVMAISFAACGSKTEDPAEDATVPATEAVVDDATVAEDTTVEVTEAVEETTEEVTEAEEDKVPETAEEIVEAYKAAAILTDKDKPLVNEVMSLTSCEGGDGFAGKLIDLLVPIGKKALEKNSGTANGLTGGYEKLVADDVASAKASDDGKYTTLTIELKQQVNGGEKEGHVGHGITVLGDVQRAIDELGGVEVDTSNGSIDLTYSNAKITVKIDNATGKIVSGTWSFRVTASIKNVVGKIGIVKATLNGTKAVIDRKITL